jgi:hypothetical protein
MKLSLKEYYMKSKKHINWDSKIPSKNNGFIHLVTVPWTGQKEYWWNEICADIVEVFGLPGERFTSHPTADNMDFLFKSEKDAQLCKILISDRI